MSEPKTVPTSASVSDYLASVEDPKRQRDGETMCSLMQKITGEKPVMWGPSIVGFGSMPYKYAGGREGEWMVLGFAARKSALTLYGLHFYDRNLNEVLALGKVKTGKGCLYIKSLADINMPKLEQLITTAWREKRSHNPE